MGKTDRPRAVTHVMNIAAREEVKRAAEILRGGGVVAFPTETVYGLGADASNAAAVRRIFEIKGRPATNPVIVHVADVAAARRCVSEWPEAAQRLAEQFWPGPLTIVLPKKAGIVEEVTAGGPTVGVRVPDHPAALAMLREFAKMPASRGDASTTGIAAPSANRSSHVSPTSAQHVRDDLGDTVDMILDGGPCTVGIESTVLSLATPAPTVLRPGGISVEQLGEVLGNVRVLGGSDVGMAASPGRQERHYLPRAKAVAFSAGKHDPSQDRPEIAVLTISHEPLEAPVIRGVSATMPGDPRRYAEHFYRTLRQLDRPTVREIWIELPPRTAEWLAVRDRILRAATEAG